MLEIATINRLVEEEIDLDLPIGEEEPVTSNNLSEVLDERERALITQINNKIQKPIQSNFDRMNEEFNKEEQTAIPACGFFPEDNSTRAFNGNQVYPVSDTTMLATVQLPHLFTITDLKYHVYSNHGSSVITFTLYRIDDNGDLETIGTTESSTISTGAEVIEMSISGSHLVNNQLGAYFLKAEFGTANDPNLKINKVIIIHHR